ncbi:MAG: xanthine dehydrogenase family protein molybdopterin-binding subunit [Pseudomonadota bacterium]
MSTTPKIGDSLSRVDGILKVTGKSSYAAEHFPADLLYGWIVSSSIAKGRIVDIDDSRARKIAGVVEIITHKNRPHLAFRDGSYRDEVAPPGSPFRPLYDDKIVYSLQPVAIVVANTLENARDAAALVEVRYDVEQHNTDFSLALKDKYEPKKKRDNFEMPKPRGDAKKAFADSPIQQHAVYHTGNHHHNPMEMHGATVEWNDGKILVHDKTQGAQNVQAYLSSIFGFSKKDVRVMNPYVGGAFGSGLRPQYHVVLATLAAKMLERSVRVTMTRAQMFSHVHRPEAQLEVSLGADHSGQLQAIINNATTATSKFEDYMEVIANWGLVNYKCDNATGDSTIASIDTYTPGDMRAPGAATGMTLFEIAMDELAYATNVDPLQLRLLNYSEKDAMHDKPFTSKALREAYAEGAERFGWERRTPAPGSMRDGSELVGWGMATGIWDAMFMKTAARATLTRDGKLEVASATADIGTGSYTVMTQVAGDVLGLPLADIAAKLGDSELPAAPVEGGSWGAASTGAAVELACTSLADALFKAAGKVEGKPLDGAKRDEIDFIDGFIVVRADPVKRVSIKDVMAASGEDKLEAEETAKPGIMDMVSTLQKSRNTHSAVFVEVKVDEELRIVRVTRVVCAVAAGRIINPKTARSQILGGVVMGIGMALHEETLTDHKLGRFMNHSFAEYHIPVNADIDNIEVIFVDEPDPEVTPLGVKGLGEIGIVGTAAAVANAIYHATGTRVRSLPVTVDKLL